MRMRVLVAVGIAVCVPAVSVLCFGSDSAARVYSGRQWQYRILDMRDTVVNHAITPEGIEQMRKVGIVAGEDMEHILDRLGAEGWELVSFSNEMAVFKRPR